MVFPLSVRGHLRNTPKNILNHAILCFPKIRNRTKMSILMFSIHYFILVEDLARVVSQEHKI